MAQPQSHAFFQHAGQINIGDARMEMHINHHHAQMDEDKRRKWSSAFPALSPYFFQL
jgi:hypothetical protein